MFDLRQSDEPVYYTADQIQGTQGNQLQDIEERHGQLRNLESDIVQLHEIHREFADMVSNTGQNIDNIEVNVTKTELYVDTGNKSLAKALDLRTTARRKKILCSACVVITLIIIAIIVTVVVLNKSK